MLEQHHTLCVAGSSTDKPLPYRLLDLDSLHGNDVILRETQNEAGIYACLSYCWGGQHPLEITQRTLPDHKSRIPWARLPKTFQDAIAVARRLGIQYLWIDSLCIIQDDIDDWKSQSALMADIYRNALITLAASGSNGPSEGLYFSRDRAYAHHELSAYKGIYVRRGLQHLPADLPLLSRGWVFQERLLSPRFLHFGRQELIWECMERCTCECYCIPTPIVGWFEAKDSYNLNVLQALPPDNLAKAWRKVVRDYTQMKLSVTNDILPAISGAAKIIAQALERQNVRPKYLAGMWECWFIENLLWYTRIPSKASRPSMWRAPTFSWASVS
ncbi:HET-domain-containing protein, partial [Zopfia rhizophila CBS 207.26]